MAHDLETALRDALSRAVERYDDRVGQPVPKPVQLSAVVADGFEATAYEYDDDLVIEANTGCVTALIEAWSQAVAISEALPAEQQIEFLGDEPGHAVEIGLRWLMQHELNHLAIGHFFLTDKAALVEGAPSPAFDVVARGRARPSPLDFLTAEQRPQASFCLELQTDHDAIEIVLGAYDEENWMLFRYYAICIAMVMLLIEQRERSNAMPPLTHPRASTRLFQLLGHLAQMPLLPAQAQAEKEGLSAIPTDYAPSRDHFHRYYSAVVVPVLEQIEILAHAVDVSDVFDAMGGVSALIEDITQAMQDGWDHPEDFQTPAAQQWAELKPLNEQLLAMAEDLRPWSFD